MRLGQILNSQPVEVQSRAKAWSKDHLISVEFHQTCGCAYRSSQFLNANLQALGRGCPAGCVPGEILFTGHSDE